MLSTACRVRASCTLCSTHLWGPTHAVFCDWLAGARQRVCVCVGGFGEGQGRTFTLLATWRVRKRTSRGLCALPQALSPA